MHGNRYLDKIIGAMSQIVLTLTLLITALTLLVLALTVLRMHWVAGRPLANRAAGKHIAFPWLPVLGAILRAAGNFLQGPDRRQIHDRKQKKESDSDQTKQNPE